MAKAAHARHFVAPAPMPEPAIGGRLATEIDETLRRECRELATAIAKGRERAERLQELADRAREQLIGMNTLFENSVARSVWIRS